MNKISEEVASQLNSILCFLPEENRENIPEDVWNLIKNKATKYTGSTNINTIEDISEKNILPETRKYLSVIFLNYIATQEEKEEFKKILDTNEKNYQLYSKCKYDVENIFDVRKSNMQINESNDKSEKQGEITELVEKKETLFSIIIMKIKKLFKRGK